MDSGEPCNMQVNRLCDDEITRERGKDVWHPGEHGKIEKSFNQFVADG